MHTLNNASATARTLKGFHGFHYAKYLICRYERSHNISLEEISTQLAHTRIKRAAAVANAHVAELLTYFNV